MSFIIFVHLLGFIAFFIHYFYKRKELTHAKAIELFLVYQMVFSVGIISLLSFAALAFWSDTVAKLLGWPTCPFQAELGNVNLSYGILGFLSIWIRGHFWTAVILGQSIWLFSDAIHHIYLMIKEQTYTFENAGTLLYTDAFIPAILLIALGFYLKTRQKT